MAGDGRAGAVRPVRLRRRAVAARRAARAGATSRLGDRLRILWRRHPGLGLALKVSLAATLAWLMARPFVDDYSYYAPLGAVAVTSSTVVRSLRRAAEAVGALLLGACLALAVELLPGPDLVGLTLVTGLGVLIGGWHWFGQMGAWVPISALFVLVLGSADPGGFVPAYVGLTAAGAALGVVVNLVLPSLPLTVAGRAEQRLARSLADHLEFLVAVVDGSPRIRTRASVRVEPRRNAVAHWRDQVDDAWRVNWRRNGWDDSRERRRSRAEDLLQLARLVDEASDLVGMDRGPASDEDPWAGRRQPLVTALRGVADLVRIAAPADVAQPDDDPGRFGRAPALARAAVARLRASVAAADDRDVGDAVVVASMVSVLERCLALPLLGGSADHPA